MPDMWPHLLNMWWLKDLAKIPFKEEIALIGALLHHLLQNDAICHEAAAE